MGSLNVITEYAAILRRLPASGDLILFLSFFVLPLALFENFLYALYAFFGQILDFFNVVDVAEGKIAHISLSEPFT